MDSLSQPYTVKLTQSLLTVPLVWYQVCDGLIITVKLAWYLLDVHGMTGSITVISLNVNELLTYYVILTCIQCIIVNVYDRDIKLKSILLRQTVYLSVPLAEIFKIEVLS